MGEWARWIVGGVLGTCIGALASWNTLTEKRVVTEQGQVAIERRVTAVENWTKDHIIDEAADRERARVKDSEHDVALAEMQSALLNLKDRISEYLARRR